MLVRMYGVHKNYVLRLGIGGDLLEKKFAPKFTIVFAMLDLRNNNLKEMICK